MRSSGPKFDPAAVDKISSRLSKEVHRKVERRLERGTKPEHVKVVLSAPRVFEADADVTKLAYHSKHGWTGGVQSDFDLKGLEFRAGVQSDSDRLLERFAGYNLGISRRVGDRVRVRFDFESFHQQWNATTLRALDEHPDVAGIYRERYHMAPNVSVVLMEPLTLTFGVDIQHFQTQFPAARFEASNAVTTTLRYRRRWESDASRQEVDAGYGLRAATRSLDSDYAYTRHAVTAEYKGEVRNNSFSVSFLAGAMNGRAPLFERFTLGRLSHAPRLEQVRYRAGGRLTCCARIVGIYIPLGWASFYDTGAVWDREEKASVKHSVGLSLGGHEGFFIAVAFPLRSGSVQPLFILGTNF